MKIVSSRRERRQVHSSAAHKAEISIQRHTIIELQYPGPATQFQSERRPIARHLVQYDGCGLRTWSTKNAFTVSAFIVTL